MKYYEVNFSISAPIDTLQDAKDLLAAEAGEVGFETFEDLPGGIRGYIQRQLLDTAAIDSLIDNFAFDCARISYNIAEAEDKDWNEQWENKGFEPIIVGERCAIHDGRHLPEQMYDITVEIDARMAFGTGTHETTRMVATALLDMNMAGKSMLDCGCGTGILGIVALKAGAAEAVGYDIDEWSADNARHNAVINRVDHRYTAMLGDASAIDGLGRQFDVVAANINRNILLADMPRFKKALKPGGTLIMSGFYTEDIPALAQKAATLGLNIMEDRCLQDNNWACVVMQ